jgi:hypothetical protein
MNNLDQNNQNNLTPDLNVNNSNQNNQYSITPDLNMNNFYIDEYPDIKELKKLIIFSRSDKEKIKVKIPISFRNNKLYLTAEKFKIYKYSEISLFHNGNYLDNNETPIDKILNGDEIVIVENLEKDINCSYYKEYSKKYSNMPKINVIFIKSSGNKRVMPFIADTTIKEIIKIYFIEEKIPEKEKENYEFFNSLNNLNINDESTLGEKTLNLEFLVNVNEIKQINSFKGKKIKISIKNNQKLIREIHVSTLDKIADFYHKLENISSIDKNNIENVIINGKEIKKDDKRTFDGLSIRKNSICNVKFKNDNHRLLKNCLII